MVLVLDLGELLLELVDEGGFLVELLFETRISREQLIVLNGEKADAGGELGEL